MANTYEARLYKMDQGSLYDMMSLINKQYFRNAFDIGRTDYESYTSYHVSIDGELRFTFWFDPKTKDFSWEHHCAVEDWRYWSQDYFALTIIMMNGAQVKSDCEGADFYNSQLLYAMKFPTYAAYGKQKFISPKFFEYYATTIPPELQFILQEKKS